MTYLDTKLRCILLDDELPGLSYLKLLCEQLPEVEVVKAFSDPASFLHELPTLSFDFCILDIEMPQYNGLEVARLLNGKPVVFTTAYSDYAADAFDLQAIDYVRKPISKVRLLQAIDRVSLKIKDSQQPKAYISLLTDKGKLLLYFDQLLVVSTSEIDKRDKVAILETGEKLTLKNITFSKLVTLLPSEKFCQVNKRELIALRIVQFFSGEGVTLQPQSCAQIPSYLRLGRAFRADFIKKVDG